MPVTHFSKITTRRLHTVTGTLCNRMSNAGDDLNVTTFAAEVTCKLCRRQAEASKLWAEACKTDRDPPELEAPAEPSAPKFGIAGVHVDSVALETCRYAIGWTIDGARFHVWGTAPNVLGIRFGEIEETICKNPPLGIAYREPGYFETRRLDRTSKAQAAIFAEVLEIVTRDDLVRKAFRAERHKRSTERRRHVLEQRIYQVDADALEAWKSGAWTIDGQLKANAMLNRRRGLELQLRALETEAAQ